MDYRLLIARRYLISRKQITLISTITSISIAGVTLGVTALIVVLSVMNGFFDFVRDMLVSFDPHVRIVSVDTRGMSPSDTLVQTALSIPHVVEAAPYVEGKALLVHEGASTLNKVVIVRGIEEAVGQARLASQLIGGSFSVARQDGRPGVVIGLGLGQRLALAPDSQIGILSAPALERMFTQIFGGPPITRFEVRGLYEMDGVSDESYVYIDLEEAQRLFRMGNNHSGIELRLDDLDQAAAVKATLQQRIEPERFEVLTWYDLQKQLYDVMILEKWGASVILMLIVIVAAFNIVGSLTMVVIEKRHDIGVLQAMGVSKKNIRRIFLGEGFLIGIMGTGLGAVLGLGIAFLQGRFGLVPILHAESFLLDAYPVSIQALDVVLVVGISMALCVLAALYPALRAANIEPAQAVQVGG